MVVKQFRECTGEGMVMKYWWVLPATLLSQGCTSYCVPYGYFDLQGNENTEIVGYSSQGEIPRAKNVNRFPSSYKIERDAYILSFDVIADRGYPTASIQVKSKTGLMLNVSAIGGNDCLRSVRSPWNHQAEIMWVTDNVSCKSNYPVEIKATDEESHQVTSFNLDITLRMNGEKCQIDAP